MPAHDMFFQERGIQEGFLFACDAGVPVALFACLCEADPCVALAGEAGDFGQVRGGRGGIGGRGKLG